jgi:hypothetical protein
MIIFKNTTILEYVHYFFINILLSCLLKIEHLKYLQCKV